MAAIIGWGGRVGRRWPLTRLDPRVVTGVIPPDAKCTADVINRRARDLDFDRDYVDRVNHRINETQKSSTPVGLLWTCDDAVMPPLEEHHLAQRRFGISRMGVFAFMRYPVERIHDPVRADESSAGPATDTFTDTFTIAMWREFMRTAHERLSLAYKGLHLLRQGQSPPSHPEFPTQRARFRTCCSYPSAGCIGANWTDLEAMRPVAVTAAEVSDVEAEEPSAKRTRFIVTQQSASPSPSRVGPSLHSDGAGHSRCSTSLLASIKLPAAGALRRLGARTPPGDGAFRGPT